LKKLIAVLVLSVSGLAITAAHADEPRPAYDNFGQRDHHFAAPEIDPSSGITALTLLLGGLTVMRSRIGRK